MLKHLYQPPMRNIRIPLLIVMLGTSIVLSGCSSNKVPKIQMEPQLYDLGEIPQEPIDLTYEIRNIGESDLSISKISTSCGCTEAEVDQDTVPAGKSTTLRVKLDPAEDDLYGNIVRVIYIRSNDPEKPEIEVEFRANILKPVTSSGLDAEQTGKNDNEEVAE